ncbi:MAG: GreA/GreB family elongation factor [Lentisphaerae bacterium]|nr:GreA/GreB family elongation factor [Lentisphaerota bacterium]
MRKADLLKHITEDLQARARVLVEAARSSHAEATDESTRSENKYDTRGLEAGYLAEGQARQARELADAIALFESLEPQDFTAQDPIDLTAVVRLEAGGVPATYFIGPKSGGLEVAFEGGMLMVITPASPLGKALMGRQVGDTWTAKMGGVMTTYRIVSVR